MDIMDRHNQTIFTFKDSHRYHWRVTTWKAGERLIDDVAEIPDCVWGYVIEREHGGEMLTVYHSEITGQEDEPIKLREILYDYLCYVTLAMMDGVHAVAESPMEVISVKVG